MEAHQVESVAQLAACGVGLVVAVGVLAIVAYQAARYAAVLIGVSALYARWFVVVGQEVIYNVFDRVGATKSTNNAGVLCRVAGLCDLAGYNVALAAAHGPGACVAVVHVLRKDLVDVARGAVLVLEHVVGVFRGAGPVE